MTREEKLKLYNEAKEAYYNGVKLCPIKEFDKLEKELGLENNLMWYTSSEVIYNSTSISYG